MAEPSTKPRSSIRGFLHSRKQRRQQRRAQNLSRSQYSSDEEFGARASASVTSSFTSDSIAAIAVAMEGMLKKRAAKMPVMHDRYCVATWEMDGDDAKCVMLRSYKNRKSYDAHPEKPTSVHQLKCISDWDGKTGFHRYQHAFTMETRDKKLFQCVAPCAADKDKWVELMAVQSAFNGGRDMRLGSVGSLVPLRRTESVQSAADSGKPRAYTSASMEKEEEAAAEHSTDSEGQGQFPGHDGLFRTTSGASTSSMELPNGDKNEPADWGMYGDANGESKSSKYEVMNDAKPVMLFDKELLKARGESKTLASDKFLFEEGGKSRFGAVVVKGQEERDDDDDDVELIDEEFAAREAQKENEKNMKRRAQKLESNRDLYAEMAAARLADMRKDARHPKKSHSHSRSHSRHSEDSEVEQHDEDQSLVVEGEVGEVAEVEEMHLRHSSRSSRSRRSSKSHKKSFVSSENANSVNGGYASGDDEGDLEEEEVEPESVAAPAAMTEAESAAAEELHELKKKYKAERRAKKRLMKEKEEEERTALEAAELARAHREEQRAREEAKAREEQETRDKKERREMKEKLKREKAKQRQAEADLRKLVEQKQAEEERREREHREKKERKDREKKDKKKSKKKEKYTSPAERIQKKEERDAERAAESAAAAEAEAEVSNALVVVEKPAEPEPAQQPLAAPAPAPTPATTSTSSSVQTNAVPTQQVVAPPPVVIQQAPAPVPVATPAAAPASAPAAVAPAPAPVNAAPAVQAQAMPMYQFVPPPFVPTYPPPPQSMPAYGLAATFGAYPPMYPAPYSYGMPPQPPFVRPNMGFMAELSAMGSFGKAAGPAPAPSIQDAAEPMIGPQLPTPEERAAASSTGPSASFSAPPPPPPSADKPSAKLTNLPELPDVVEF